MNKQDLANRMTVGRKNRYINNIYSLGTLDRIESTWTIDDSFIASYEDNGIKRLLFSAIDYDSLNKLIEKIDNGKYYLEFLTKNANEYVPTKSTMISRMMRLSNNDCKGIFDNHYDILQYKKTAVVEEARVSDVKEINSILWSTFHTEISHLLTDEELTKRILEGYRSRSCEVIC